MAAKTTWVQPRRGRPFGDRDKLSADALAAQGGVDAYPANLDRGAANRSHDRPDRPAGGVGDEHEPFPGRLVRFRSERLLARCGLRPRRRLGVEDRRADEDELASAPTDRRPRSEGDVGDDVPGVARGRVVLLAEHDGRERHGQLEPVEHGERAGDPGPLDPATDRDVRDEGPSGARDTRHERRLAEPAVQVGDPRRVPAHLEVDDGGSRGERARRPEHDLGGILGRDAAEEPEHLGKLCLADVDGWDERDVRVDAAEPGAAEGAPQAVDLAGRVAGDRHGDEQAPAGRRHASAPGTPAGAGPRPAVTTGRWPPPPRDGLGRAGRPPAPGRRRSGRAPPRDPGDRAPSPPRWATARH